VLGHSEVVSFTEVHNSASRAVMERLGMTFVKIIYERGLIEGRDGIHAAASFALYRLRREYAAPPPAAEAGRRLACFTDSRQVAPRAASD
jgi:RimJ/RimL family protein N-acetyltransferase